MAAALFLFPRPNACVATTQREPPMSAPDESQTGRRVAPGSGPAGPSPCCYCCISPARRLAWRKTPTTNCWPSFTQMADAVDAHGLFPPDRRTRA